MSEIHVLNYEIRRFGLTPDVRGVETIDFGTSLASTNLKKIQSRIPWIKGSLLNQYNDTIDPNPLHCVSTDDLFIARYKASNADDESLYEIRVSIETPRRI